MQEATSQLEQFLLVLLFCLSIVGSHAYNVPKATVKVNAPQGFEVSIPDEPGISLFAFHGKVNEEMADLSDQTWATDIVNSRNGRWIYTNRQHKLRSGDVLYYWTTVRYHGIDYHNYNQRYRVGQGDIDNLHINVHSKDGTTQPIIINGNPTINIYAA